MTTTETKVQQEVGLPLNQVLQFMLHMQGTIMAMQTDIGQAVKSIQQIQKEADEGQTTFDDLEEPEVAGKIGKENKDDSNDG